MKYVRMIGEETVSVVYEDEVSYSTYLWASIWPVTEALNSSLWILGPVYGKDKRDNQICVTGGVYSDESMLDGTIREVGQEMGLVADATNIVKRWDAIERVKSKVRGEPPFEQTQCVSTAALNTLRKMTAEEADGGITYDPGTDDKAKKIACVIYGTKEQCMEYLSGDIHRHTSDRDDITGFSASPVGPAKKHYADLLGKRGENLQDLCGKLLQRPCS